MTLKIFWNIFEHRPNSKYLLKHLKYCYKYFKKKLRKKRLHFAISLTLVIMGYALRWQPVLHEDVPTGYIVLPELQHLTSNNKTGFFLRSISYLKFPQCDSVKSHYVFICYVFFDVCLFEFCSSHL